jgi:hypothetical protein
MTNGDGAEKKVAKLAEVEPEPEIGVVCRKVQVAFFIEQTEDGETVQEFKPESVIIYQRQFGEPLNLKAMADNLCEQAMSNVQRGQRRD